MFSIYMSNNDHIPSSIMFGNWDKNVLKPNDTLNMIKTVDASQWSMWLGDFEFMNKKMPLKNSKEAKILFDPSVPFIQIPPAEWNYWYSQLNQRIKTSL